MSFLPSQSKIAKAKSGINVFKRQNGQLFDILSHFYDVSYLQSNTKANKKDVRLIMEAHKEIFIDFSTSSIKKYNKLYLSYLYSLGAFVGTYEYDDLIM